MVLRTSGACSSRLTVLVSHLNIVGPLSLKRSVLQAALAAGLHFEFGEYLLDPKIFYRHILEDKHGYDSLLSEWKDMEQFMADYEDHDDRSQFFDIECKFLAEKLAVNITIYSLKESLHLSYPDVCLECRVECSCASVNGDKAKDSFQTMRIVKIGMNHFEYLSGCEAYLMDMENGLEKISDGMHVSAPHDSADVHFEGDSLEYGEKSLEDDVEQIVIESKAERNRRQLLESSVSWLINSWTRDSQRDIRQKSSDTHAQKGINVADTLFTCLQDFCENFPTRLLVLNDCCSLADMYHEILDLQRSIEIGLESTSSKTESLLSCKFWSLAVKLNFLLQ